MKRCPNCSIENPDDATFCRNCSSSISAQNTHKKSPFKKLMGWILSAFATYCFLVTVDGIMVYNSDLYSLIEKNEKYMSYSIRTQGVFGNNVFSNIVGGKCQWGTWGHRTEELAINELKTNVKNTLFLTVSIGFLCGFLFYRIRKIK